MAEYIKNDSEQGVVQDSVEIEFLKFKNMRHSVVGCMMGDFDAKGKYVIKPEIANELIAMKKYIVESFDNIDICNSQLKLDRQLTFFATVDGDQATLSLVEKLNHQANFKLNGGVYSDIIEFELDRVEVSGEINKNVLYKKWNIGEFGGQALDVFNMDEATLAQFANIVNRFKYVMKANEKLLKDEEEIEEIEAQFGCDMLRIVSHYPELHAKVKADIKAFFKDKKDFVRTDKPNFARTVNEIILQTIENNMDALPLQETQEFLAEKRNAELRYNTEMRDKVSVETKQEYVDGQLTETRQIKTNYSASVSDVAKDLVLAQKEANVRNANKIHQGTRVAELEGMLRNDYGIEVAGSEKNLVAKTETRVEEAQKTQAAAATAGNANAAAKPAAKAGADKKKAAAKAGKPAASKKESGTGTRRSSSFIGAIPKQSFVLSNTVEANIASGRQPVLESGNSGQSSDENLLLTEFNKLAAVDQAVSVGVEKSVGIEKADGVIGLL